MSVVPVSFWHATGTAHHPPPDRYALGPRDRPLPLYTPTKITISRIMTAKGTQS